MAKKYYENKENPPSLFSFFEKGVAALVDRLLQKNKFAVFPKGEISQRFQEIETMEPKLAVIEADKLVDSVMKRAGIRGNSMADRLRRCEKLVDRFVYQEMWDAHKLRNHLVHEVDHHATPDEAMQAIWKMKKFLVTLGVFKNE
jgi:hypothetical protein